MLTQHYHDATTHFLGGECDLVGQIIAYERISNVQSGSVICSNKLHKRGAGSIDIFKWLAFNAGQSGVGFFERLDACT
jgi:hypothetical protein